MANETVRELALQAFEDVFKTMRAGQPVEDPYTITWSVVARQDLGGLQQGKRYAMSIIDTTEQERPGTSCSVSTLRVLVEWFALVDADCDPSTEGNRIIGEIKRRAQEDRTLGGVTLSVRHTGNELSIDDFADRKIDGTVVFDVMYRHAETDPRVPR